MDTTTSTTESSSSSSSSSGGGLLTSMFAAQARRNEELEALETTDAQITSQLCGSPLQSMLVVSMKEKAAKSTYKALRWILLSMP